MKYLILVGLFMSMSCAREVAFTVKEDEDHFHKPRRCRNAPNPRRCRRNRYYKSLLNDCDKLFTISYDEWSMCVDGVEREIKDDK